VHREVDGSELTLRIVPDDNSCLFNAVAGLQLGGLGEEKCAQLRESQLDKTSAEIQLGAVLP
jgi:hypothetical protein